MTQIPTLTDAAREGEKPLTWTVWHREDFSGDATIETPEGKRFRVPVALVAELAAQSERAKVPLRFLPSPDCFS